MQGAKAGGYLGVWNAHLSPEGCGQRGDNKPSVYQEAVGNANATHMKVSFTKSTAVVWRNYLDKPLGVPLVPRKTRISLKVSAEQRQHCEMRGVSARAPMWLVGTGQSSVAPIISNKGPCLFSWGSRLGTVNYTLPLVTSESIFHIYLTTEPVFPFLLEAYLMGQVSQGTHFRKHYKVAGGRRQGRTSPQTGHMKHPSCLQSGFIKTQALTTLLCLKKKQRKNTRKRSR